jgi:hypothetical protein
MHLFQGHHKKKKEAVIEKQHEIAFTGNSADRTLAGRKPIRAVMQDLQKRIQHLKSNPTDWDALQKRVGMTSTNDSTTAYEKFIAHRTLKCCQGSLVLD